jgi:ferrochelatase
VSPINAQCRLLLDGLREEFRAGGIDLPIYWGNRNWAPMLEDTVRQMKADGIRSVLALATSAFGSYSGCRQYREDIDRARTAVEGAPEIEKLPPFPDNPGFLEAVESRVSDALAALPGAEVVYTAHSVPVSMAESSPYEHQLRRVCAWVNQRLGLGDPIRAYQSRSGPPTQPWLGPDIVDHINSTSAKRLIAVPVGFLSDHMEVIYDLDTEAAVVARQRGIEFLRAATVGTHPRFIAGIREMVEAAMRDGVRTCAPECCKATARPARLAV